MDNNKSNFRRGSVELMVLYLLSLRDYYGYELTQILKEQTNGVMDIPVGSLYPALYTLVMLCVPDKDSCRYYNIGFSDVKHKTYRGNRYIEKR